MDALVRVTAADVPVWGSYRLGDGAYVVHAGDSEAGHACLGLVRDGSVRAYAAVADAPSLLTPLYGYYFAADWYGGSDDAMLERAEQPPSIRVWLDSLDVESAVVMPATVPDFPMEIPAVVKVQLAIHEGFHVEVQGPRWWAQTGAWPTWDVQPDRAGVSACYTETPDVARALEEERESLVRLVESLMDEDTAAACEAGAAFLSLRADRYGQLADFRVGSQDGQEGDGAATCEDAEALMELEEGTADYASWTVLYDLGEVDRGALTRRYRAIQDELFYLTGAMQLHAVQLMAADSMLAITRRINESTGPEEGAIGAVFARTLGAYCP